MLTSWLLSAMAWHSLWVKGKHITQVQLYHVFPGLEWWLPPQKKKKKITVLPQRDNSDIETSTTIRSHIGRRHHRPRRDCLWHSSGVYFFFFFKCAWERLCLRAASRLPWRIIRRVRPVYLWLWWAARRWWPVGDLADRAVMDHSSHTLAA